MVTWCADAEAPNESDAITEERQWEPMIDLDGVAWRHDGDRLTGVLAQLGHTYALLRRDALVSADVRRDARCRVRGPRRAASRLDRHENGPRSAGPASARRCRRSAGGSADVRYGLEEPANAIVAISPASRRHGVALRLPAR